MIYIGDAHRPAGCPGIDMPVSEWQYIAEDTSTQSDVMQCEKSNYAPEGKSQWIRGRLQEQLWIVIFSNVYHLMLSTVEIR